MNKIKTFYIVFLTYIFRVLPINNRKIMFCNFFGKGYGCNSKYICDYIIKNKLNYKLIWIINSQLKYEFPKEIICVKKYSLRYFYHLATSKIFVDNQHKDLNFKKRRKQVLIKTWHATLGLKRIGLDNPTIGSNYKQVLAYNDKITNFMISNCEFITSKFRRVFDYKGEIYECGFPRNDILIRNSESKKNEIRKSIGKLENKKILLYAPTFRENLGTEYYNLDYESIIKKLNSKTNEEWVVLVKLHPHLWNCKINFENKNVINISTYDDIQELLLISDILITDYSNIMFEFGLMRKHVILYAPDYEEYKENRNYYFTYQELPFSYAFNNEEVIKCIDNFNLDNYVKKINEFYGKLGFKEDGNACQRFVEKIEKICNEK